MVNGGKTAFFGNCGNGERRIDQQLLGFSDPNIQNILLGCHPVTGLELLSQIYLTDPQAFGKLHIGKIRVLYMLLDIFLSKRQPLRIPLIFGSKNTQQFVKAAENIHTAFVAQEHLLQGLKTLDAILRIIQRNNNDFIEFQTAAEKIDKRKQAFTVGHPAVGAALGHEDGIARLTDIPISIHSICNLTTHTEAHAKILPVFHIKTSPSFGTHDRWLPNFRDNQFIKRDHKYHPKQSYQ